VSIFGTRNRDSVSIFSDLDNDFDGKVDIFEVLSALILWSKTDWDQKVRLLFDCFDFNAKGTLRPNEVSLMCSSLIRCLEKVVRFDNPKETNAEAARKQVFDANGPLGKSSAPPPMNLEDFVARLHKCPMYMALRTFVDENSDMKPHEEVETPIRKKLRLLEYRCQELSQHVEALQAGRQKLQLGGKNTGSKLDSVQSSFDKYMSRLVRSVETQQQELTSLITSFRTEGVETSTIDPRKRFKVEQALMEIEVLQNSCGNDIKSAEQLLQTLTEEMVPATQALKENAGGNAGKDTGGGINWTEDELRGGQPITNEGEVENEENFPVVVCFADFDPPTSQETLMLTLRVGDEITATGQDGQGWWYGKTADGRQGWFPPSYVQVKE